MTQNHYWKNVLGEDKLIWLRKHGLKLELLILFLAILIGFYYKGQSFSFGLWIAFMLLLISVEIRSILREDEFYNKGFNDGKEFQQEWNETGKRPELK